MKHATSPETKREYVCGWGAAFINITVTFPLNKVCNHTKIKIVNSATEFVKELF